MCEREQQVYDHCGPEGHLSDVSTSCVLSCCPPMLYKTDYHPCQSDLYPTRELQRGKVGVHYKKIKNLNLRLYCPRSSCGTYVSLQQFNLTCIREGLLKSWVWADWWFTSSTVSHFLPSLSLQPFPDSAHSLYPSISSSHFLVLIFRTNSITPTSFLKAGWHCTLDEAD